ncbi:MAG: HpcH/HpaI aldolase/citrate lyase family protein, partial [Chloroflexi bacterium]|nr:HpcH/HpaI aldolase/citrate lyase family protein [Chloroflexota bacterium]
MTLPLIRSWLYAPGNNPKLLRKVFEAGADAVILDLEDAVPASEKGRAREAVAEAVAASVPGPVLFVRINHPGSSEAILDVEAVAGPGLRGLRIPKVETAATVTQVESWLQQAGSSAALVCNIESARGAWNAAEIASAGERVVALAFGAVDFCRDINAELGADGDEVLYARSRLVLDSRVAG